jgi:hypothetical protein
MSDHAHGKGPQPDPGGGFDSEIDVRRILEIGAWLAAITVGSLIIGYFLYRGLGKWADRADPTPSPLAEASLPVEPPAPRLQKTPELELRALRKATADRLASWGWVDKSAGIAHMPIDEAIARLAVPEPAAPAPDTAPAAPAPAAEAPAAAPHASGSGH